MKKSVKRQILIPLFAGLAILLGAFTVLLYITQRDYLEHARTRDRESVTEFFQNKLKEDAEHMNATLAMIAQNPSLVNRFVAGDRDGLLAAAAPVFRDLKARQGITHLYFVTPERIAFLRVHRPEQFGDTIPRASTLQAVRTNQTAYGLELGRLRGLLTLRVVQPWYAGERLIGYLELGQEITSLAQQMKAVLHVDFFVTVDKHRLDRSSWEAGMRMFARTPRWDDYPGRVLIDHTMAVPADVHAFLKRAGPSSSPLDVKVDDRRFFGAAVPLLDISSQPVGDLIFLRDFTPLVRNTNRTLALSALVAVLVGLASVLMLYARTRHHFIEPLLELRAVAERAGQGELVQAAAAERPDELGDLARSLNRMIVDLRNAQAEQTRLVLDAALDAVVTFDLGGRVIDWNRQAETLFGWSRADAIGRSVFELMGSTGTRAILESAVAEYRGGTNGVFNRLIEDKAERRGGETIPVELAIAPVGSGSSVFFSAFIREISDRKRLEADLQAAQRLEAVGKLAGGIAHDFNNLITAIVGYTTAVQDTLAPGTQSYEDSLEIRRAADRATSLVQQLLAFARKRVVQPRIVDVNELVVSIDRMLRRLIGEHIQLDAVLDRGIWPVLADPGQLEQVLVNLAVNARDAMPEGGRVTIRTANVVISGSMPIEGAVPPGHYVQIAVSDTGVGMNEDTLTHIFEPFFTTKKAGEGTGLGLATCYGIVKQAGGYIRASSERGRGSAFRIYLPRTADASALATARTEKRVPQAGHETILLVEDEHQVRRLIERALRQQGYQIICATNGVEAIEISRGFDGEIHLLLTDVVMPELGGREAAAQIRQERPDTKVIYMSGYSEELVRLQGELAETAAFIAKPFAPDELRRVVRDVLNTFPAAPQVAQA